MPMRASRRQRWPSVAGRLVRTIPLATAILPRPIAHAMSDLFSSATSTTASYNASDIEVLEGLEPVRRRPGMYVGGTDERAFHHLAAEVLDNAMDEAVAGHASRIEIVLEPGNRLTVTDNGRGIPVDPHPKFPGKSALEVIMSTLHSGGKFEGKAYATSGGLHGVGVSVVNALSSDTVVEVARNKALYRQRFARGITLGPLEELGPVNNRRGTSVAFTPDTEIFGPEMAFKPARLHRLARSKAYLFAGVEIRWKCAGELISDETPAEAVFQFPGGLADHLREQVLSANVQQPIFSVAARIFPMVSAGLNGQLPGRCGARVATVGTATRFRRPTAVRMRPGFARLSLKASGRLARWRGRKRPMALPPMT